MADEPKFIAEIQEDELCVRMLEAGCCMKRPPGTAAQALGALDEEDRASLRRQAIAAINYIRDCINGATMGELMPLPSPTVETGAPHER